MMTAVDDSVGVRAEAGPGRRSTVGTTAGLWILAVLSVLAVLGSQWWGYDAGGVFYIHRGVLLAEQVAPTLWLIASAVAVGKRRDTFAIVMLSLALVTVLGVTDTTLRILFGANVEPGYAGGIF